MKRRALLALCLAATLFASETRAAPGAVYEPDGNRDYKSSREVLGLKTEPDGALLVWTGGGELRLRNGALQKLEQANRDQKSGGAKVVNWRGQSVRATLDGLQIGSGKTARMVAFPPSRGTHISALLPRGDLLWAAVFGDGIWAWNGANWTRPALRLPIEAREITALAQSSDGQIVWLGTRRQGVWELRQGVWKRFLPFDEPFAHNVQALQSYGGALWASTLEDGLIARDARGWKHWGSGELSSNAPRQMAVFQNRLYVRHSNEVVDCFDGKIWTKNVFPRLPRRQILSLAADEAHLYLGQWGGWSEWNGRGFSHHLTIPALQIVPLMQIFPDAQGHRLWLGTENRGLFEWNGATQTLAAHDERDGLPDDWITAIATSGSATSGSATSGSATSGSATSGSALWVGTFNGGLAHREAGQTRWQTRPEAQKGISALVEGDGQVWIGTHFGLYRAPESGDLLAVSAGMAPDEREIQALLSTPHGLWVGTRNGLFFRTRASLSTP